MAILCLSSCAFGENRAKNGMKIFAYAESDADYDVIFSSALGDVTSAVKRRGEVTVLTVTTPVRSAGVTVKWTESDGRVVISYGEGEEIPLSEEAARGVRAIFELLGRGKTENLVLSRSDDGEKTLLEYGDGVVILNAEGIPCSVVYGGRTVEIANFTVISESGNTKK